MICDICRAHREGIEGKIFCTNKLAIADHLANCFSMGIAWSAVPCYHARKYHRKFCALYVNSDDILKQRKKAEQERIIKVVAEAWDSAKAWDDKRKAENKIPVTNIKQIQEEVANEVKGKTPKEARFIYWTRVRDCLNSMAGVPVWDIKYQNGEACGVEKKNKDGSYSYIHHIPLYSGANMPMS